MDIKVLIQALARPWFIEENQASTYAELLHNAIYVTKDASTIFNADNRNRFYETYQRVDANSNPDAKGEVQIIRLQGPLMKNDFCFSAGMESMQQAIRAANADATVKSIVLLIDSPGGTVDGTDNLAKEIKNSKKPVVAFANGMMCSAAYWIGSSAKMIIADNANNGYNATIGSIGTMCMWKDTTKQEEMQGVKTHIITATKSTNKIAKLQDLQNGKFDKLIKELDNLNETFLTAVQSNRAGKLSSDTSVLSGETYDAKDALKNGLIDKIGSIEDAVKYSIMLSKTF